MFKQHFDGFQCDRLGKKEIEADLSRIVIVLPRWPVIRLSWNDGRTESWMFTDVDESATAGLSINGKSWGRPDDTWGIAGVINGLSGDGRKFFEQAGLGILVGDGRISYSPEMILETYYAFKLCAYATFSPDYQFIANPGYNTDRGPVNMFTGRLHLEF